MKQTDQRKVALNHYSGVMREIKQRVQTIEWALNNKIRSNDYFTQEFCYLQLRFVYELIALACLVAHGDIVDSQRVKTESAAGAILGALERLQPNFFPLPTVVSNNAGGGLLIRDRPNDDFLTKSELLELYGRTGNFLHRGTYRNIFEVRRLHPIDFEEIQNQAQRIFNLLGSHSITLVREKHYAILCSLAHGPNRKVRTVLMSEI